MNVETIDIVFQETPGEISISFSIVGCKLQCPGCHSSELWDSSNGTELTFDLFESILDKYKDLATCVLFLGGEWEPDALIRLLKYSKSKGLKTCLYTGELGVETEIFSNLDYLKTGRWIRSLGGLDSTTTNQKYIDCKTGENLNHLFRKS